MRYLPLYFSGFFETSFTDNLGLKRPLAKITAEGKLLTVIRNETAPLHKEITFHSFSVKLLIFLSQILIAFFNFIEFTKCGFLLVIEKNVIGIGKSEIIAKIVSLIDE